MAFAIINISSCQTNWRICEMKHLAIIIITIALLFSLCGCSLFNGSTQYIGERTDLYRVALYSIPLPRGIHSITIDKDSIETDTFGRSMFYIRFPKDEFYSSIPDVDSNSWLVAAFIIQKSDEENIYYYEDACFTFGKTSRASVFPKYDDIFDQEAIKTLKDRNDWDQPLQISNCVTRPYSKGKKDYFGMEDLLTSPNGVVIQNGLEKFVNKKTDKTEGTVNILPLDTDTNNMLYYATFQENKDASTESFFIIVNADSNDITADNILKVETLEFGESLHKLKENNGWVFSSASRAG